MIGWVGFCGGTKREGSDETEMGAVISAEMLDARFTFCILVFGGRFGMDLHAIAVGGFWEWR